MKLNQLSDNDGSAKTRTRVGRGIGSGKGKTAGRGVKGQKSRSGVAIKGFEGGQMPIYRRLPKRGFHNPFAKDFNELNVGQLQAAIDAKKIDGKKPISIETLIEAGLVKRNRDGLRLLGNGEISAKVKIEVAGASKGAIAAVEKAGGSVTVIAAKEETPEKKAPKAKAAKDDASQEGDKA